MPPIKRSLESTNLRSMLLASGKTEGRSNSFLILIMVLNYRYNKLDPSFILMSLTVYEARIS